MNSENFRLDRFEELFDRIEDLSKSPNPDLEEVATTALLAMINDQLAFLSNQFATGRLPSELAHAGMKHLESPFIYGYLIGGGAYVGKVAEDDTGGHAAINAMRVAYAETYREHAERNWEASQAVSAEDPSFTSGLEAGSEDLRFFLSRLQGIDIGSSCAMAGYVEKALRTSSGVPSGASMQRKSTETKPLSRGVFINFSDATRPIATLACNYSDQDIEGRALQLMIDEEMTPDEAVETVLAADRAARLNSLPKAVDTKFIAFVVIVAVVTVLAALFQ